MRVPQVRLQVVLVGEILLAQRAGVLLLAGVYGQVTLQVPGRIEAFIAVDAVIPVSRTDPVYIHVYIQVSLRQEALRTDTTPVGQHLEYTI